MRPKTLHAVTDEQVYDAVVAELSAEMSAMDAATYAHNVVARLKEPKIERVSDITGFSEDDDFNQFDLDEIKRTARAMRRIPRMPGGKW